MQLRQQLPIDGTANFQLDTGGIDFPAFAQTVGYGVACNYTIVSQDKLQYERGVGSFAVGGLFSRTTVVVSSNANALVTFSRGSNIVCIDDADIYAYKTSDQTLIGTAYADVSGTGLPVAASTSYEFEFNIIADADAVTTGIDIACNGPAAPTAINYTQSYWSSATVLTNRPASAYNNDTASANSSGTTRAIYSVRGILRNGANAGTLIARIKREAVGTGPNARIGSYGRLKKIA